MLLEFSFSKINNWETMSQQKGKVDGQNIFADKRLQIIRQQFFNQAALFVKQVRGDRVADFNRDQLNFMEVIEGVIYGFLNLYPEGIVEVDLNTDPFGQDGSITWLQNHK